MHVTGRFKNIQYSENHKLIVCFEIEEKTKALEEIEAIKNDLLIIDAQAKKDKRSLDANAYFWVLADKIAKKVKSDKWSIYLWLLSKYGVFVDVQVVKEAVESLEKHFRFVELIDDYGDMVCARCYYGQSTYNTTEMFELIQGTVTEAKELGIETLTPDEITEMIMAMARKGI